MALSTENRTDGPVLAEVIARLGASRETGAEALARARKLCAPAVVARDLAAVYASI